MNVAYVNVFVADLSRSLKFYRRLSEILNTRRGFKVRSANSTSRQNMLRPLGSVEHNCRLKLMARGRFPATLSGVRAPQLSQSIDRKERPVQVHVGRLIDHVHLRVSDLEASKRFYRAVFVALGLSDAFDEGQNYFSDDELWVDKADGPVSRIHLAFQAPDRQTVEAFYRAALGAGGRDNGAPGERSYHPGCFAAFAFDSDGNSIEADYHGASKRSAPSVVISPVGN